MVITFVQFAWGFAVLVAWTGLLLGAIKYLLNRQITAFETKLAEADAKAAKALEALAKHERTVAQDIAAIRQDIGNKLVCSNHPRMESDNIRQFKSLTDLSGKIEKIDGKLDGIINSIDLLMQHHIKGGN
ncbi:MAG: hypothetical protein PHN84_14425 [Desulfuromonadaceae bacterium]|nr:hypothetical protein [Desulfuromonadaceae bacterium]